MKNMGEVCCFILGDGPAKDSLINMSKNSNVKFLGSVKPTSTRSYLSKFKALIIPSVAEEGFPNVIIESMSVGTPVIGTDVSSISEIINQNNCGLIVQKKNSLMIQDRIKTLINDSELLCSLSSNSIKNSLNYHWDRIGPEFEKIFSEAIN